MTDNNFNVIIGLKPEKLWHHFAEISSIPRPSKKEEKIKQYLINFAINKQLEYKIDKAGNIIIYKEAQKSSSTKTVILQSHLDMVCEKEPDINIDFDNEPIILKKEAGLIKANGTTLGADNGIGVATMLAILENKNLIHPDIEALFTIDEEKGMTGAKNFDVSLLNGDYIINLDTEEENIVYIGSAGSENLSGKFTLVKEDINNNLAFGRIIVEGLRGGHSGSDIHKNHLNAIKVLGLILYELIKSQIDIHICYFRGGKSLNAIPRVARCIIAYNKKYNSDIAKSSELVISKLLSNYRKSIEPRLKIKYEQYNKTPHYILSKKQSETFINTLNSIHHGIYRININIKNIVETSNNLGVVLWKEDEAEILNMLRSEDMFELDNTIRQIISCMNNIDNIVIERSERIPSWKPILLKKNPLLKIYSKIYHKICKEKPIIMSIHAALECGYFDEKMPDIPIISIGPDIRNAHTPDEYVSINSTEKFWKILTDFLRVL